MRAAFYECDITPPLGGLFWGHYSADAYAKGVMDRLYARAAVIEGEDGTIAAFVTVDTCALPHMMHDTVTKRIEEYTGIPASSICITSNHTHWGAPVSDSPEIECYADVSYRDVFFRLTADAVTLAYRRLAPAEAFYGEGKAEGISFCRDFILDNGSVITWAGGIDPARIVGRNSEPDPTVRTIIAKDANGKPVGALVSFSCHQCCCGKNNDYTGDFSSIMSEKLKEKYGNDFVAVFLPGAAGDITHVVHNQFRTPSDHYRKMGNILSDAVVASEKESKPLGTEVATVKEPITVAHRQMTPEEYSEEIARLRKAGQAMRVRNMEYYNTSCKATEGEYLLQAIRVGELCIYVMPGEVFIDLGRRVMEKSEYNHAILVHNSNTYCGYIPTKEAFGASYDLYETSLCYHSCLVPEAGEIMTDKVLALGKTLE
jgi:hypothetical protein